jgi:hypothetical protein
VNVLSDFFASVFTEEQPGSWDLMNQADIDTNHIKELLTDINPDKSPGPDGIHPRLLKEASELMVTPLHIMFKKSLETAELPNDWKLANISAIHKKGDKRIPGNYRPISLTSVVVKLLEKLIRNQIVEHMKAHQLLSNKQYGFVSGRSTLLQLLTVLESWIDAIEKGEEVDVIFNCINPCFEDSEQLQEG